MQTKRRLGIGAAVTMMLGSICPWAGALGLISLNGLQCRFGWVTLLAGGLLITLELRPLSTSHKLRWLSRYQRAFQLGMSSLSVVTCLLATWDCSAGGPLVQAEWGLYLTLVAAVVVVGSALRRTL